MSWKEEVDELRRREALAREMGGAEKVARQHAAGRLTVRERIARLLDPGSFHEVGALTGKATYQGAALESFVPANFVFGRGRIAERPVVVAGDDFTVRGGAADAAIYQKQVMAEQMANELRLPILRLVDGTGGGGSVKQLATMGRTYLPFNPGWDLIVQNLATVPVVGLALGPAAGLGAARLVSSHYSIMVKGLSQVFVAGPPLVAAIGEQVEKEQLGGSAIHARNGVVDEEVATEDEAFARARRFLSYLPQSVHSLPERTAPRDPTSRRDEDLLSTIPRERRKVYKARPILESVFDTDSLLELGRQNGRAAITALARLDGWPVAVLASDPHFYGGSWNVQACEKVIRFLDLAETFHLPVVHLVDQPGFPIGTLAEKAGTIRVGARLLSAVYQATVPWCSIILRRAFGVAGAGHQNHARLNLRYAWPSGDWGSLPLDGGIEAAFKADLAASDDPAALRARIDAELSAVRSPFRTAEAFWVEEIIDPRDTRPLLCEFATLAAPLRTAGPSAHGLRP